MHNYIKNQIQESVNVKQLVLKDNKIMTTIKSITLQIIEAYQKGNKTIIAGNGGSAADAQHLSAEFVGKYNFDRPALPSIALTTNTSVLTAIGNDYGYDNIFSRQIEANGVSGDVFIGISTSGNSKNVIEAFKECKKKGIITVGLTGKKGGEFENYCSFCLKVPSIETPRIQEIHILIGHIICSMTEESIFGKNSVDEKKYK